MKKILLPTFPTDLPETVEVRDYELDDGTFVRVVMEIDLTVKANHFHMSAQAWDMNADGTFKQAPNGYASRSNATTHTVHEDDIGDTIEMDDSWVRHTGSFDPVALPEVPTVTERPTGPGAEYGQLAWDPGRGHAWRWTEGYADGTARAKIENLSRVLRTTDIRSGFAFRKKGKAK